MVRGAENKALIEHRVQSLLDDLRPAVACRIPFPCLDRRPHAVELAVRVGEAVGVLGDERASFNDVERQRLRQIPVGWVGRWGQAGGVAVAVGGYCTPP